MTITPSCGYVGRKGQGERGVEGRDGKVRMGETRTTGEHAAGRAGRRPRNPACVSQSSLVLELSLSYLLACILCRTQSTCFPWWEAPCLQTVLEQVLKCVSPSQYVPWKEVGGSHSPLNPVPV